MNVTDKQIYNAKTEGKITENGIRENIKAWVDRSCLVIQLTRSALSYCAAWISGNGCVPINGLMEDAATAEIARVQLWQWVKYGSKTVS